MTDKEGAAGELAESITRPEQTPAPAGTGFRTLLIGSIGVVYGDVGTSPLYAPKESLKAAADGGASPSLGMSAYHRLDLGTQRLV